MPMGMIFIAVLNEIVEEHARVCHEVGENDGANVAQSILVQRTPWRVRSSEEDGLEVYQRLKDS